LDWGSSQKAEAFRKQQMISANLNEASLTVDESYGGSRNGNYSDDPLPKLLAVDNGAGFRVRGKKPEVKTITLLALKSSLEDMNWPDSIDRENGLFIYYGDRRKPGDLHDTPRQGNLILRNLFEEAHSQQTSDLFPPIFLFGNTGTYRDVRFLGLAVLGAASMSADDDLVAVWRTTADRIRFQNYKATFTILDVAVITRQWITDIQNGNAVSSTHAPKAWLDWVRGRKFTPLLSTPTNTFRTKQQQLPETEELQAYISLIHNVYKADPYAFERCAMEIARLFLPNIHRWEVTRPWRDGGRDALGTYRIGQGAGAMDVEFALEAKCYGLKNGVGVKALARLISRLRHRQFGILVTTSYLNLQAYQELVADKHPVVVISAQDIAVKLKQKKGSLQHVKSWIAGL
jgi:Restriction endonuclease AspBHI N-terminal/Restriction endonuclease